MSLVVLDRVSLSFAERVIFSEVGARISETDRIGLIGPNGSGKTTLLRLIAGEQSPDRGSVQISRGVRIGYLPQDLDYISEGQTLKDMVLSSVPGRKDLDAQLEAAEADLEQMQSGADDDELMASAARISELHERIDHFERFYGEHEAMRILGGLGFATSDRDRDLTEFSGGWKMRAFLAALLYQQPDLLLLDEPTNHLDMPSVGWFSEFLARYKRAFVLISHDREFLNEQIARVLSLEPEGLRNYPGDYDHYVVQREEEAEILEAKARNIAREKERMQRFIDRFRAQANKAAAVQSRVKQLEKLEDVEQYQRRKVLRFSFPKSERAVGDVVKIKGLRKAFGDNVVFPGVDLTVRRGEKIAIIGANGAGKTTLLRLIAGEIERDAGEITIGNKVSLGYYAQHHADTLDRSLTAYQAVEQVAPKETPGRIRSVLGAFLFSGDDVDKRVSVLSGGERARIALSRLLIRPANLLMMDEPTNHLDLVSSDSLGDALAKYDGTLVFVSHNRSLIRKVATRIWNIEGGRIETYSGTLDEYLYSCRLRAREGVDGEDAPAAPTAPAEAPPAAKRSREDEKTRKRKEARDRQRRSKLLGPIEQRIARLEDRIGKLETKQSGRSAELSDPAVYDDAKRRNQLLDEFQKDQEKLDELTGRWEAAIEELEKAGDGLNFST